LGALVMAAVPLGLVTGIAALITTHPRRGRPVQA